MDNLIWFGVGIVVGVVGFVILEPAIKKWIFKTEVRVKDELKEAIDKIQEKLEDIEKKVK